MTAPLLGPETYLVCDACNYDRHTCHFCGDDLPHTTSRQAEHGCYRAARTERAYEEYIYAAANYRIGIVLWRLARSMGAAS